MATLTITNVSTDLVAIGDIYRTLAVGESVTVTRTAAQIPNMVSLQKSATAGLVTVSVALSADEIGSGLATATAAVESKDVAPVAATDAAGGLMVIRKAFTAGTPGTADDVTVFAVNTLPAKMRVVDAHAFISTAIGATTVALHTAAAAGGTLLGTLSSAATGRFDMTGTATAVATPGASAGLFLRRSDRGVAGEVIILCRPEN